MIIDLVMSLDNNEPAKLTEKMRSEITDEEPIDNMVKPVDIVSPEVVETDYEEITSVPEPQETTYIETAKIEKPERGPKIKRTKKKRPDLIESRSLSKLQSELRKHSDARKKTDLAIKNIEKRLKGQLITNQSAIKNLKKEITQLRRRLVAAESRKTTKKSKKKTSSKKTKKRHV